MSDRDFDHVVVIGMPTDHGKRRELAKLHPDGKPPLVYTGSVKSHCVRCGDEVWVGPRAQVVLSLSDTAALLCPWCAKAVSEEQRARVTVRHLGNPERRDGE